MIDHPTLRFAPAAAGLLVLAPTACGDDDGEAGERPERAPAPQQEARRETLPGDPNAFDPSTLEVGDAFLGLRVAEKQTHRTVPDSLWAGAVRFRGEVRVSGTYARHFDAPEVDALCLEVDAGSRERLPVFLPDDSHATGRRSWFCFRDRERALALLGPPAPPRDVTVVVDGYEATRRFTDAWDTAELVSVVDAGGASGS